MIDWHRLFGLTLYDFFTGSPYVVELEKDLSMKRQLLDVVILRRQQGEWKQELPDGLENLAVHNLLSYKSLREPFDDWALKELTGHYVNYRKQVSPSWDNLLPEDAFRLYGVSTRFPQKLSAQVTLQPLSPGVFEIVRGTDRIRLIVLSEIAQEPRNTIWQLFSGVPEAIAAAACHYRGHTPEMSTVINQLFENYQLEGIAMPYTMEDFQRDYIKEHIDVLTPEEILQRFSPEDRLKGLSPEEILKRFSLDDRLKGISLEEIQQYLKKFRDQSKE
jgi:hypothetical protein